MRKSSRQKTKTTLARVEIYLPPALLMALAAVAKREHRTISAAARHAIAETLGWSEP